jgi:hypothetical protein
MPTRGKIAHRTPKELNLISLARSYTNLSIKTIAGICQNGSSEMARLAAASILLDRGWGKAAQAHTGEAGEGPITVEIVYRTREPREPLRTGESWNIVELKPTDGAPPTTA